MIVPFMNQSVCIKTEAPTEDIVDALPSILDHFSDKLKFGETCYLTLNNEPVEIIPLPKE